MKLRPHLVLDLETVVIEGLGWEPPSPGAFPPAPLHRIVAAGALAVDEHGARWLRCLGEPAQESVGYEERALQELAELIDRHRPTLVTFNGRGFDFGVVVARCLRHRVPLPAFWRDADYQKRYSTALHVDMMDQLALLGAGRCYSLDLASKLIGRRGKGPTTGRDVASLWEEGRFDALRRYVLSDVVETAQLWLRWEEQRGRITRDHSDVLAKESDALSVSHAEAA